jgi:sulfhydrogenase subunit gamma (sulfur reductase)
MHDANLVAHSAAGGGLLRVRIAVDDAVRATHQRHAQYVELRHQEQGFEVRKGYFVLASAPGDRHWEVLMRADGSLMLRPNTALRATDAMGPGFPLERAAGRPLLLVATGSGVGAIITTVNARIESGEARQTRVLYGVRGHDDIAIGDVLTRFRDAGIEVEICLSKDAPAAPTEHAGYVQDRAAALGSWLARGTIFAAGQTEMVHALRARAALLGVDEADVLGNQ